MGLLLLGLASPATCTGGSQTRPYRARPPLSFGHFPRERGKPWRSGFRGIAAVRGIAVAITSYFFKKFERCRRRQTDGPAHGF